VDEELKELWKAPMESIHSALDEEVVSLRRQVQDAEKANAELILRSKEIYAHYKAGDLVSDTKQFAGISLTS